MSSIVSWVLGRENQTSSRKVTQRGLPASWYRSPELYELERRAIFSRQWLLVTHTARFTSTGDYIRFNEAGFSFFLCLDKDGSIRGFHNICRHRGFPIVQQAQGNAKIFSCKYHGWSYGLSGKLAKAPYYQDFEDFEKEKNSLFPVHVHVDKLGFVWVNLEAAETPSTSWEEQLEGADTQKRLEGYNMSEYSLDHCWDMQGDFNWKTLGDNYNECYHCKTAHPDVSSIVDLTVYRVEGRGAQLQHFNKRQEEGRNEITVVSTYFFPNACVTITPHFFYMMRCVPTSATTCDLQYEVYRHKNASDTDFNTINEIYKRVLSEDKWLCNETQQNLNAGTYVNGQLHSEYESGPLYLQGLVRTALTEHRKAEEKLKKEIWPAMQQTVEHETTGEDMAFCAKLGNACEGNTALAW